MNYLKTLKDLFVFMKNTRLPETQMKELQNRKLRTLLHFAWEHSAFYRHTFEKAGITEEQLDNLPLSAFPTIDKTVLMEHFDELITVQGNLDTSSMMKRLGTPCCWGLSGVPYGT